MSSLYNIDASRDIPIYRQLVDVIRTNIKSGKIAPGTQLPTVRELADELGIARGTIKRSYDELEHLGIIEKIRGRGTFVCYKPTDSDSRKERAMASIDAMFDELDKMDFSMAEINIFLNLKLRERASSQQLIKAGIIECNPEILSQLSEQLHAIAGIDIYTYLLDDIKAYPYKISEDMDVIITTAAHAEELAALISQREKIAKIALQLTPSCAASIIKLEAGSKAGILCSSSRFGQMIYDVLRTYAEEVETEEPVLLEKGFNCANYLKGKDVVLLPEGFRKFCSNDTIEALRIFESSGHRLIMCGYRIDEGSFMYLEDKIERMRDRKKIKR